MAHSVSQGVLGLEMSDKTKKLYTAVAEFMEEEVFPAEEECWEELNANTAAGKRWTPLQAIQKCKDKAKAKGLWNFFLPPASGGGGLTNFEYAPICELTGRSHIAPEATLTLCGLHLPDGFQVFNCNAPDTGNMEILSRFATPEQKKRWLEPLLEGEIRSCFGMTGEYIQEIGIGFSSSPSRSVSPLCAVSTSSFASSAAFTLAAPSSVLQRCIERALPISSS